MRTKCVHLNHDSTVKKRKKRQKMTKNNLKVVKSTKDKDLENKEKNKALEAAISQITDNFFERFVMKLSAKKQWMSLFLQVH